MPLLSLLLAAAVIAAGPLAAQQLQTGRADVASPADVTLLTGWRRADGRHVAAIAITLAPGWHTYWRIPGASGIPPQFDWSASRNLAAVEIEWPRPVIIETAGFVSIGYLDEVILPVILQAQTPDAAIAVDVSLFFGVCAEICVPAEARLRAELGTEGPASGRALIEAALADRPMPPARAGVTGTTCTLQAGANGAALAAEITFDQDQPPGQMVVIEIPRPGLRLGLADTRSAGRTLHATAPIDRAEGGLVLDRDSLRLTVLGAGRAIEIAGCTAPG